MGKSRFFFSIFILREKEREKIELLVKTTGVL